VIAIAWAFIWQAVKSALGVSTSKEVAELAGETARDLVDTVRLPSQGPSHPLPEKDVQWIREQERAATARSRAAAEALRAQSPSRPESAFPPVSFPVTPVEPHVRTLTPPAVIAQPRLPPPPVTPRPPRKR
jgi:hypothetical protein